MLCPLKFNSAKKVQGDDDTVNMVKGQCLCEEDECAWWISYEWMPGYCCFKSLNEIANAIGLIVDDGIPSRH